MGKPTGFLEFKREMPEKLPVAERIQHFKEFENLYSPGKLKAQAGRCMNCGIPFCHSGCPLGNPIHEFNQAVYDGNIEMAYEILSQTNDFPEFTGRICPAPCESACVLSINNDPVTIEEVEKHIIELAFKKGIVKPQPPLMRTGKRVAVIGSGPAGLAAAVRLNRAGHHVTVFERDDEPGGLLRYGIPDFKLEKWVIERRIEIMKEEGVEFQCGVNVGVDVPVDAVLEAHDAVLLAGGALKARDLTIPGSNLKGVHLAMKYLTQQNRRTSGKEILDEPILAEGKDVVVVGGGDTGSDCIGTAHRQGAKVVTQLTHGAMPPSGRNPRMPWPLYPEIFRISSSQEEGGDRLFELKPTEFTGDSEGNLTGLRVVPVKWNFDEKGRRLDAQEMIESAYVIPCQLAFVSVGFVHPEHEGMLSNLGVELDNRGNVKASDRKFETSIEKVFSAGDMRRGQSLVVWAQAEGRDAAHKINEFLAAK
ncbi:MAG: glutamate synthase subunit beta [Mucilaginibacter polytrichastri]|nr:glutamate synthase subunit beta [Mucilaginibacter polytrichastri]